MFEAKFHTISEDGDAIYKVNYYDTQGPINSGNPKKGTYYTRTLLGSEQIYIPEGTNKNGILKAVKDRMKDLNVKNNLKYKDTDIYADI